MRGIATVKGTAMVAAMGMARGMTMVKGMGTVMVFMARDRMVKGMGMEALSDAVAAIEMI